MVWFNVDDNLAFHRKTIAAGNAAMGLWVRAGSWCAQQLEDGFVPADIARTLGTRSEITHLVSSGLWETAEKDGRKGYRFHQWHERNRSRSEVEAERAEARKRMKRVRDTRKGSPERTGEQPPEQSANEQAKFGVGSPSQARPYQTKAFLLTLVSRLAAGEVGPPPAEVVASWQDLAGPGVDLEAEAAAYLSRFGDRPPRDERGAWLGWLRKAAERTAEQAPASSGRRPERAACPSHPDQPATTCAACAASTPLPEGGLRALIREAS